MRDKIVVTCCVTDPAIDMQKMMADPKRVRKFTETRDWQLIAPFIKPGEQPTKFHIRQIPSALWTGFVQAGVTEAEKVRRAFRAAVIRIENLVQDDGSVMPQWEGTERLNTRTGDEVIIGEDEADVVSHVEIEEIGTIAYHHSFLHRRTAPCWPLAPGPYDTLIRQAAVLDADESHTSAASSNEKQDLVESASTA